MNKSFTKKDRMIINTILICCFLFLAFVLYWFRNPFVSEYKIEAGSKLTIEDLLVEENPRNPEFITQIDESITHSVGVHNIKLKANNSKFTIPLTVEDTTAPKVTTKTYNYFIGDEFDAKKFIKKVTDFTNVTPKMKEKIDLNKEGTYTVNVDFTDEGLNTVSKEVKLKVQKDTKAPVIEAPTFISVVKGESVLYKKQVKVTDNRDGEITDFTVDNSQVNLAKEGSYYVTYTASDEHGNTASKKLLVVVTSKQGAQAKEEAKEYADKILKQITTKNMSDEQKLRAIYDYVRVNYKYIATHEGTIDDYYVDALTGFKTGKGDCYVVNAMARFLLEEIGIETYGLVLHGSDMDHISFMVNLGDGWYHYCAFKKKSGIQIYKWTDAQMIDHYSFAGITSIPNTVPDTPKK